MPHFYPTRRDGDLVEISGPDARHLAGPLRARVGERIAVVDPAGFLLSVKLTSVSARQVTGTVVESRPHRPEPSTRLTMAIAMLPAASLEHVLSRCTELGAHAFVLVDSERSVARGAKPERWATICREAAMLAGRLSVPAVSGPLSTAELVRVMAPVMLDSRAGSRLTAMALGANEVLAIGPEGGWSPAELALTERRARLGATTLRADTAAVAALTAALVARGDV